MQTTVALSTHIIVQNDAYSSATESVILQDSFLGYTNFNLIVTNYDTSPVTIQIYTSADGFNYFYIQGNAIQNLVSSTASFSFVGVYRYIQVSASSAAPAHIHCCLMGDI